MARERYGNGYKGRAATRRKMRANFRGFADHSARSLKPVHGRVGPAKRRMAQSLKYGLNYGKAWR
jgi:predicted NAD/FAD-dependent oxidoreductase